MRNLLRPLRGDRGWTQADLAAELGVSRQTVNSIEKGRFNPSLNLAFRISAVFDLAIEDIFQPDRTEEPESLPYAPI